MRHKYLRRQAPCLAALLCGVALCCQPPLRAQDQQQDQKPAPLPPALGPVPESPPPPPEWEADAALQAKVSLEARRMPLSDLLAELQKQGGVGITAQEGAPVLKSLVTARLRDMSVGKVMSALSRIYDVRWSKQDGGYLMRPTDKDGLSLQLMRQYGMSGKFETTQDAREKEREGDALAEEIYHSVGEDLWKAPEGVAVASLPQDVQQKLFAMFKAQSDQGDIDIERMERRLQGQKLVLRLHRPNVEDARRLHQLVPDSIAALLAQMAADGQQTGLFVYTADGLYAVAEVFPSFRGPRTLPEPPPPPPPPPG